MSWVPTVPSVYHVLGVVRNAVEIGIEDTASALESSQSVREWGTQKGTLECNTDKLFTKNEHMV